jgi:chaperonin GroEL
MTKKYDNSSSLQQKLIEGIDILADNVASTLGPRGRNVIIHQKGKRPFVTKDGVTVAKFVQLEDEFQNAAVEILKQASEQTNDNAGDGTTTATVLSRAIYKESIKHITAGANPIELKRGIDACVEEMSEQLDAISRPISSLDDIKDIATISANGDKTIGSMIAMAVDQAGKDGAIIIEEARSVDTSLDVVEGFRFASGYLSPRFVTDDRRGAVKYENALILVTDEKITAVDDVLPALEIAARESRPFLIVADSVEEQALAALIMNAVRGTMKVAAVKAPFYGEERRNLLKDLAISVGATFYSKESGNNIKDVTLKSLGTSKTVDITNNMTTIVDGNGDDELIDELIENLKEEITTTEDLHAGERTQERITRLASGIAMIKVGAPTEVEMIEKKHRLEDALEAVKAAQHDGIVAGGGVALLRAAANTKLQLETPDQVLGAQIVMEAIREPIRHMARNAGESADLLVSIVETNSNPDEGIDFATNQMVDMFATGIVDPCKVTKTALRCAASVASTLLTTNYAIVEV